MNEKDKPIFYSSDYEYIENTTKALTERHDIVGYLEWRFGYDADGVAHDWGEALGRLMVNLGMKEYQGEPIDADDPPVPEVSCWDDAEAVIEDMHIDWDKESVQLTCKSWMEDEALNDYAFRDFASDENYEDFNEGILPMMGLLQEKDEPYLVLGSNMGWQHLSGFKIADVNSGEDIIDMLHGDYDYSAEIYHEEGKHYLTASVGSHDAPTGEGYTIIPASWLKQALEEDPDIRKDVEYALTYHGEDFPIIDMYLNRVSKGMDETIVRAVASSMAYCGFRSDTDEEKEIFASNMVRHTPKEFVHWAQKKADDEPYEIGGDDAWDIATELLDMDMRRGLPPTPEIKALKTILDNLNPHKREDVVYRLMTPGKEREQALGELHTLAMKQDKEK